MDGKVPYLPLTYSPQEFILRLVVFYLPPESQRSWCSHYLWKRL